MHISYTSTEEEVSISELSIYAFNTDTYIYYYIKGKVITVFQYHTIKIYGEMEVKVSSTDLGTRWM
jgi:hypothetical protein